MEKKEIIKLINDRLIEYESKYKKAKGGSIEWRDLNSRQLECIELLQILTGADPTTD